MGVHIDKDGKLHQDRDATLALNCPHCEVFAQVTPSAVPSFDELQKFKPKAVGVVYRCAACNAPIFLRYPVRAFRADAVELGAQFEELERLEERFSHTHLPDEVALLFREALACFTDGHFNALASMCRRTIRAAQRSMDDAQRQAMIKELSEALRIAELDGSIAAEVQRVIFGSDAEPHQNLPIIDGTMGGTLVELMKDLLYQTYVRPRRLRQSLQMRRYFAEERGTLPSGS